MSSRSRPASVDEPVAPRPRRRTRARRPRAKVSTATGAVTSGVPADGAPPPSPVFVPEPVPAPDPVPVPVPPEPVSELVPVTVQLLVAGVGSAFPAASVAHTLNVWSPTAMPAYDRGDVQPTSIGRPSS